MWTNQDMNVGRNLVVTGNITAENVFLPQYIRSSSNSTIAVHAAGNWTNITFAKMSESLKHGISHTYNDITNETFTIGDAGVYQIDYTISIRDSAANPDAHVCFQVYSTTDGARIKGSYKEIDTAKQNEDLFMDSSFLVELSAGEQFKVQFTSDDTTISVSPHGTYNPAPSSAQISLHKVSNV